MIGETSWDKLLGIRTEGRDASLADHINYPYEPTPYSVLERLAGSGWIGKKSVLLDYGCGKGRVDFFLAYQTRCRAIGIDYDERMAETAGRNREKAVSGRRVQFFCENAAKYEVPAEVNVCYFFNPFSLTVLQQAMARIFESYYNAPREITLLFYYPSDEYLGFLMTQDLLVFEDEIPCGDLFPGTDPRERILCFQIYG